MGYRQYVSRILLATSACALTSGVRPGTPGCQSAENITTGQVVKGSQIGIVDQPPNYFISCHD